MSERDEFGGYTEREAMEIMGMPVPAPTPLQDRPVIPAEAVEAAARACGRKTCTETIPGNSGKKYCSARCARNAALVRRRARANVPLEKAVASSTQYTMKKLMLSATYLANSYKVDVEEVKEMLVNDMERRFDKFWEDDSA